MSTLLPTPFKSRQYLLLHTTASEWAAGLEKAGYVTRFVGAYVAVCTQDKTFTVAEYVEGDETLNTYQTCEDYMTARRMFVDFHQDQNS